MAMLPTTLYTMPQENFHPACVTSFMNAALGEEGGLTTLEQNVRA